MNNCLEKVFIIIAKNSKKLSSLPNYVKLIMNGIDQPETDFVMAKNIAI